MIGRMLGHYRIEAKLGEGGMGVVYRALDTHLERPVAIKVLRPEAVADPERKRRFVQEAKAASALNHPNIITIYDISAAEGTDFIAMEYVRGKTLDQLVGRKGLGLREALKYAVQAADALAKAHAAGIVHRDIKPGNIMVTEDGLVKMLDFGLAKLSERTEGAGADAEATESVKGEAPRTEEGAILGTVAYMSPEQAEGKTVDARSDIFSFGSVLYEMLTGQRAFTGETRMSTLSAILRDDPKPVSQLAPALPREVERIIARCLRKDLGRRFQHMADLKVALEELKEESESGRLVAAPPLARPAPRWKYARVWVAGLVALLVLASVGAWRFWFGARSRPAAAWKVVPLTSYSGFEFEPAFSPDGNQVAFIWDGDTSGKRDVYVRLIDGGTPLQLTKDPAPKFTPAWSPDGRRIAFVRAGEGTGVFLIPALGGPERRLAQLKPGLVATDSKLSWYPDGKFLAASVRGSTQESWGISLLSTETGELRRLTSPPAGYGDYYPAFSPDGRLAFVRRRSYFNYAVFLLTLGADRAASGEPQRLTSDDWDIHGLDWMPDGKSLLFSAALGSRPLLWRLPVSGGTPEQLPMESESALHPTVSRLGARLAYEKAYIDTNIWLMAVPGASGGSLSASGGAPTKVVSSTRLDGEALFSPNGKRIVFTSTRTGSREAWVANRDGSSQVQLTSFNGPAVGSPRWSPDGQWIAFDAYVQDNSDIYVVGAEGGKPRRLTPEPSNEIQPSWSRDGKWVYFSSNRTGADQIWKVPPAGGAAVQVTRNRGFKAFEGPDSKFLFYGKRTGLGIWKLPLAGGEETLVVDGVGGNRWSVVGNSLYFGKLATESSPASIWVLRLDTGKQQELFRFPNNVQAITGSATSLAVSPDEHWILYEQIDRNERDLMLVENFR